DGIARLERTVERLLAGMKAGGAAACWHEALILKGAAEDVAELRFEPGHDERRGDRPEQRAELAAADTGDGADAFEARVVRALREGMIPVERLAKGGD